MSDELIDLADFLPTFCDIAGISILEANLPTDGISFWDTLQGKPGRDKPWSYIYYPENGGSISARSKTHMLLRPKISAPNGYKFFDASQRYSLVELDTNKLSEDDQTNYENLMGVINFYDIVDNPPISLGPAPTSR